jgi:hypothetical protein
MPECERCSDFTDLGREGNYHYCKECREKFDAIRQSGVIVRGESEYDIVVSVDGHAEEGGLEESQVDALARGKLIADELGVEALFEYGGNGSTWVLSEYLTEHPDIQVDVSERLSRVPEEDGGSLLNRIKNVF